VSETILLDRPEITVRVKEEKNELHFSGKVVYFEPSGQDPIYLKVVYTFYHVHKFVIEGKVPSNYPPKEVTSRMKERLEQLLNSAKPSVQDALLSDLREFAPDLVAGWENLPPAFVGPPEIDIIDKLSHRWEHDPPDRWVLSVYLYLDIEAYFWFSEGGDVLRAFSQAVDLYLQGNKFSFSPNRDAVLKLFRRTNEVVNEKVIKPLFYTIDDQNLKHLLFLDGWDGNIDRKWSEGFTSVNARIETSGENPYGIVLFSFRYPKAEGFEKVLESMKGNVVRNLLFLMSFFPENLTVNLFSYDPKGPNPGQRKLTGSDALRVINEAFQQYL